MIYIDTQRPAWAMGITFRRFFGTTALLGATAGACILAWMGAMAAVGFAAAATAIRTWLFLSEQLQCARALRTPELPAHRAALTTMTMLPGVLRWRVSLFAAASIFSVVAMLATSPLWATLALLTTLAGCVLERYTFFTACAAPRMPGL
jgi:DMSO reductase anchor subunit